MERVAVGGGVGIIGLLLYLLLSQLGGGPDSPLPSGVPGRGAGQSANDTQISESCQYGRDANTALDCEVVAVVNSLDAYWTDAFARSGQQTYRKPRINFFNGGVNSGCGSASSGGRPILLPCRPRELHRLAFLPGARAALRREGGPFARAYVIPHEYGHHVITNVTDADIGAALDTAARIGDDFIIQSELGGRVNESQFTHGTSEQRQKWYLTGYQAGNPDELRRVDDDHRTKDQLFALAVVGVG